MLPTLMLTAALAVAAEPKAEQVQIDVRLLCGDPLGSRAEGTLKHLSEPKLITQSDRPAFFRSGGRKYVTENGEQKEQFLGTEAEFHPVIQADGKVKVEMTVRYSSEENGERLVISRRDSRTVEFGNTFKKRLFSEAPDKQLWVEVTLMNPSSK